jgi:hypothetical protein
MDAIQKENTANLGEAIIDFLIPKVKTLTAEDWKHILDYRSKDLAHIEANKKLTGKTYVKDIGALKVKRDVVEKIVEIAEILK